MRTRQLQQLQADVMARLDEAGSPKPAAGDSAEWLNQAWAKVYRKLIQSDIKWNLQTTTFTTTQGQDSYGFAQGAWWGTVFAVVTNNGGSGYTSPPNVVFTGGGGAGAVANATITGGAVTGITVVSPGLQYTSAPTISFSGGGGTGAAATAVLQGQHFKTHGVDIQISQTQWFNAHRFQFEQRNDYRQSDWSWPRRIMYDLWGGSQDPYLLVDALVLKFIPIPNSINTVRHLWYPTPQRMVNPTDAIDGIAGAEVPIVLMACADAALQTEQFELADRFEAKAARELEDVISTMRDRNVGEAPMARVARGRPTTWTNRRAWWRG